LLTVDVHRLLNMKSETCLSVANAVVIPKTLVIRGYKLLGEGKITVSTAQ